MHLIKSPHPFLQQQVKDFDFEKLDAETIAREMTQIMFEEGGIGLSANQVGLDARIFVIKPHLLEDKSPLVIINPHLESVTVNYEELPEGCLSHPDLFLSVKRPRGLIARYLDIHAKECTIELYDIDARCFLHEYDHLNGIEFTERVSKLKLDRAKKKRQKLNKRKLQHG